jgi:hypothetical protein
MMRISVSREALVADLKSYGEDAAAGLVPALSDEDLRRIEDVAARLVLKGMRKLPEVLALAAVEALEGAPRPLRWKRRKIKGLY